MFTVKLCHQRQTLYYETDAFETESLECGVISLRFSAQNDERWVMFAGLSGDIKFVLPEGATKADRAYIMNDQGKTIEVIR